MYKMGLSDVGDWWDGRISAVSCFSNSAAEWVVYDHPNCSAYLESGSGSKDLDHNDDAGSIQFECPSNKDYTNLMFCNHVDCDGDEKQRIRLNKFGDGRGAEVVWEVRVLDSHWEDDISGIETGVNGNLPKDHAYWLFYRGYNFNGGGEPDLVLRDNDECWDLGTLDDDISSLRLVITDSDEQPGAISATKPEVTQRSLSLQNYPNPFNPSTKIFFSMPAAGTARVQVYDVDGSLVETLLESDLPEGRHEVTWSGRDAAGRVVPSGVYFYVVSAAGRSERGKMILLK
jgi:hypothetical protein